MYVCVVGTDTLSPEAVKVDQIYWVGAQMRLWTNQRGRGWGEGKGGGEGEGGSARGREGGRCKSCAQQETHIYCLSSYMWQTAGRAWSWLGLGRPGSNRSHIW